MSNPYAGLEPRSLWRYFDMVSQIPRASGDEARIIAALKRLGREKGLEVREDRVGNIAIVVPPSAGCDTSPSVALQAHVDMVCEKNNDVDHDFATQGIEVLRDGDWLFANGTTLGADNGIGVAAALSLIDDPPARHGPLELLFTVDEERGLTGAAGIAPQMLTSRVLLNLDSEEEGSVTVGCAGGGDTIFELPCRRETLPAGWELAQLTITGLQGGHSGIDIVHNRANSLRCLGRTLDRMQRPAGGLRLLHVEGGSKRNAIPREARALLALPGGTRQQATATCAAVQTDLQAEFAATDPQLCIRLEGPPAGKHPAPLCAADSGKVIALLLTTPTGVLSMNRSIAGLVETSTNLGVVQMEGDSGVRFVSCSRSAVGPALEGVRQSLRALGESFGATVRLEAAYPGWAPDLESSLLRRFRSVHLEVTGREPEVIAIHAGLECGIIGERFPGVEMISFGPDMHGVHAPGERLSIPSTQRFRRLLGALVEALA